MTDILISNGILLCALMCGLWLISAVLNDVSIVDIFWGLCFVAVAWNTWRLGDQRRTTGLILPVMTTLWGLRLSLHLAVRNLGRGEDFRYAAMRQKYGRSFILISLVTVFLLQGFLVWVISLPIQLAPAGFLRLWPFLAGAMLWTIGLIIEATADWQLARFRNQPQNRGRVLQQGLWKYSRHPNYFGDCCAWWGLFLTAFSLGAPLATIVSPVIVTMLLLKVSGVALLEKTLNETKPEYRSYVQRTSSFFPLPPAKEKSRTKSANQS